MPAGLATLPAELVPAPVVAVLVRRLRLGQAPWQVLPLLALRRRVPVVVVRVPRADVPHRRRLAAGRPAHLHRVLAAVFLGDRALREGSATKWSFSRMTWPLAVVCPTSPSRVA